MNVRTNAVEKVPSREYDSVGVAQGYARWASLYDHAPNPLLAREERHLLSQLYDLRPKRFLDLACGTGRWMSKLERRGFVGTGIDLSSAMLRVAQGKLEHSALAQADACALPFPEGVFDLAICSFALAHVHDVEPLASELARVMDSEAHLFVTDLHPDAYKAGWRTGFRDQTSAVQIETVVRRAEEMIEPFVSHEFRCVSAVPLWLGEPEKPVFERAGKADAFDATREVPAILVLQFTRSRRSVRAATRAKSIPQAITTPRDRK